MKRLVLIGAAVVFAGIASSAETIDNAEAWCTRDNPKASAAGHEECVQAQLKAALALGDLWQMGLNDEKSADEQVRKRAAVGKEIILDCTVKWTVDELVDYTSACKCADTRIAAFFEELKRP